MMNYAPYVAIVISVVVNVALVAYAWGTLRQIVFDLKEVVFELRRTVDSLFPRMNSVESRMTHIEAVCNERHKDDKK